MKLCQRSELNCEPTHFLTFMKKIKPKPFHKIMKGYILKVNSSEISKVEAYSISLCWLWPGVLMYYLKVKTRNRGISLKNTLCTMAPVGGLKSSCGGKLEGGGGRGLGGPKVKGRGAIFMVELTYQLFYQNYVPILASFAVLWYALHNILSY